MIILKSLLGTDSSIYIDNLGLCTQAVDSEQHRSGFAFTLGKSEEFMTSSKHFNI